MNPPALYQKNTIEEISYYFPQLSEEQLCKIEDFVKLLQEANKHINLISRHDIEYIYTHHILHSLAISMYFDFSASQKVLDLGTGAGLPGIPLAILSPQTEFILVDSIKKKIRVLKEITEEIKIKNVHCKAKRGENEKKKYDYIVCRYVAPLSKIYQWTKRITKKDMTKNKKTGIICLKGGDISQECETLQVDYEVFPLYDKLEIPYFKEKKIVFIPH